MKSRTSISLLVFAGLVLMAVVFHGQIFAAMGAYLIHADAPQKADVAVVLAGDGWGHRILTGAQLDRDGYVSKVLVSGPDGVYGNHECETAIPFAVKKGYPESYFVHVEHSATSTRSEAEAILPVIRKAGYKRIAVVTSNYHTRRAGRIFRSMAPDLTIFVIAAPDEKFTPNGWWHDRDAQKVFVNEWAKTVANWLGI